MKRTLALIALSAALGVLGCGSDSSSTGGSAGSGGSSGDGGTAGDGGAGGSDPGREYSASIVRTTYGIPHITGSDFGNLGYGLGYAYAQDNFCVLMREIVIANAQGARYFGEGFANSDFVLSWANSDEFIENEFLPAASATIRDLARGYAAGMNRYLEDTGVDGLAEGPEGCRGEEWVRAIDETDMAKRLHKLILRGGLDASVPGAGPVVDLIMAGSAAAPAESMANAATVGPESIALGKHYTDGLHVDRIGSNAYGVGAEGSQTDYGVLLGNPHFPWSGPLRFYESHLTVPGEYDMMGASLHGVPLVLIGFNKDVAWSHTVSTAQRFTFFELQLDPSDPFKYQYDDETRDITSEEYTIEVMLEDGTVEKRTESIYFSQYGPIIDLGAVVDLVGGWPTASGTAFAFADVNLTNTRILDQFLKMGQSTSIDDLEDALKDIGIPWVNTIAADRNGTGYYADVSTVPNVTQEQLVDCAEGFSSLITDFGVASLNGSRSECEWGTDPDGPPGLLGFANLPKLRTGENVPYVANANDSYWLSHPNSLLEGFSPLMGRNGKEPPERIAQGDRQRQCFIQGDERLAGTDGLSETGGFTVELMQQVHQGSRNLPGELTRDAVVTLCLAVDDWSGGDCDGNAYSQNPLDADEACDLLETWDGRFNNDSVGAGVWRELWNRLRGADDLWAVPFEADDPVNTPNTLNADDPDVAEAALCALGGAVDRLIDGGVAIDATWGQLHYRWNADRTEQIPIHGGSGMFNNISAGFVQDEGWSNITAGNSYVQTVTWDESDCPDAYAVLTYSQSTDPASPHYDDQTRIWSDKVWNDMPFCPEDIEAEKISDEIEISTEDTP
jgi:acyl-homoserine-lactone acylase